MDPDTVATEDLLAGTGEWIDSEVASRLAHHPLESIDTEFPHYVRELASPEGPERPSDTHPVFYGCYDWHSAVHSHWALLRQLRLVDDHPDRAEIRRRIDSRFTAEGMAEEAAYLEDNPTFEKPYGWAWLLHLAAELSLWEDDRASAWRSALAPLEETVVDLVETELLTQDRPFRVGTHDNTAFALHCVLDYARTTNRGDLADAVADVAIEFYAADRDYPIEYEPLGWDFLSPALAEADLLRRVYDAGAFRGWLEDFLPGLTDDQGPVLPEPVAVDPDPEEGVALHLVGLNVQRAWAMAGIADALPAGTLEDRFERAAAGHAECGLEGAFTDDYAGAHWLSSFVLYLATRNAGGIAPE